MLRNQALETLWTCWTWLGFAPGLPGTSSGFPEPCWTWPVSAPNPRPSREPSEPSPEPRWTWPGACTSAHRSYSGLKTPSAYAVGEKYSWSRAEPGTSSPRPGSVGKFCILIPGSYLRFLDDVCLQICCKISFGCIPNSRNVWFNKSFWRMLRSQALETLLNLMEPDLALRRDLLCNLLRNLLHLTWVYTKNLLRNLLWTWPGSAPKPPRPSPEPSPEPVEPDLALHQGFLEPFPESSPEPCWIWPGSAPKPPRPSPGEPGLAAPKPPRPSPEPSSEPCWTWPGSAAKPPGTFSGTFSGTLLNLTWLCTKASQTFSRTFFGTLLNLTRLCTKASQTFSGTF